MNGEQRHRMKLRSVARLRKSKAYVLLAWDGVNMPVFSYSVEPCTNKDDLRHIVMQSCAARLEDMCRNAQQQLAKKIHEQEQNVKVEEAKEKRSEELGKELENKTESGKMPE